MNSEPLLIERNVPLSLKFFWKKVVRGVDRRGVTYDLW